MPENPSAHDPGAPAEPPLSRRAAREARGVSSDPAPETVPAASAPTRPQPPLRPSGTERTAPTSAAPIDALFEAHTGRAPATAARHDKDRRKSRVAAWAIFLIVLGLLGGVVAGGFWVWNTYENQIRAVMGWEEPKDYDEGLAEGEATVTVVSGQTGADISRTLFEAGVTKTSDAFYSYLIESAEDTNLLKPGVYVLQQKMTSEAAFQALRDPANKLESTAQLREGLTVDQSVTRIAEGVGLPLEEVEAAVADPSAYGVAAESLEGWLFPATYTFDPGTTAAEVIQTMVDQTISTLDAAGVPEDRREEILTIASIIQKEARYEEDFFKVSRVIANRLDPAISDTNGLLQMDSTAQYGFAEREGGASSTAEELTDDNGWNTYVRTGLPIGPISNPGALAIAAAMDPAEGPWQYFVTVNLETGETEFTETLAEHEQAVRKWREWCAANPDGGC